MSFPRRLKSPPFSQTQPPLNLSPVWPCLFCFDPMSNERFSKFFRRSCAERVSPFFFFLFFTAVSLPPWQLTDCFSFARSGEPLRYLLMTRRGLHPWPFYRWRSSSFSGNRLFRSQGRRQAIGAETFTVFFFFFFMISRFPPVLCSPSLPRVTRCVQRTLLSLPRDFFLPVP